MRLTKWTPLTPIDTVFDRLDWGFPAIDKYLDELNGERDSALRLPRTNIRETENAYEFSMEMPGVNKKDVEVHIEGDSLVIKGEHVLTTEDKTSKKDLLRREFRSSRYERTFTVGTDIDRENIKATMTDGVLTVTLPKTADKVGRKVDVS